MGISIGFVNYNAFRAQMAKLDRQIQQAAVEQIHTEARRLALDMPTRAAAFGRLTGKAGRTIELRTEGGGATVKGGGHGLGGVLFKGAEYGGRRKRKTYAMERNGTVFVVNRRRTTMQFLPHLGTRGYFFWPTIRRDLTGVRSRMNQAIERGAWRG